VYQQSVIGKEGLVEFQEGFNKFPSRLLILTLCSIGYQSNPWKVMVMIDWNLSSSFTGGSFLLDLWVMPILAINSLNVFEA